MSKDALRFLLRLKARGWLRTLRRRLSTPSGILFALVGLAVVGLWIGSLFLRAHLAPPLDLNPALSEPLARAVLLSMVLLSVSGALAHRGLYLPAEEIERLFSAPLERGDLVRYRLKVHFARALPFALILGFVFAPRLPVAGFGLVGILIAMMTLTVVGQGAAIAIGGAESRFGSLFDRMPVAPVRMFVGLSFWVLFVSLFFADDLAGVLPGITTGSLEERLETALLSPAFQLISLPLAPWARTLTATTWLEFLPAAGLSLLLWRLLLLAIVRLPVDFRTLSLATSADVARRLSKLRSGRGMISGAKVSTHTIGWKVPWIFGHGAFGAVAWRELCAIVRKSRSTLLFFAFVMGVLTLSSLVLGREEAEAVGMGPSSWESALLLGLLGTIYLGMGLRFDFRSELDLMETMKAWPLASWRIFLGVILPEVVLVSSLVLLALLLRAAVVGSFPPGLFAVLGTIPLLAYVWTALDNAVFLLAPVRFNPEQGSSMHFAGRSVILVFVRMMALLALVFALAGSFLAAHWATEGLRHPWPIVVAALVTGVVAGGIIAALAAFGGWAFARFDVARQQLEAS